MIKITGEQLLRLWRAGIPLRRAGFTFANAEDRAKWSALDKISTMEIFQADAKAVSGSEADTSTKIIQMFSRTAKVFSDRSAHQKKLQQDVLKFINGGHLHGFGFEPPRTLNTAPVAIPKRAWSGHIDWENNTLTFESIKLVEVRLTTNRIRNEILERGNVDKTPVRSPGRPGVRQAIEDAFHALNDAGRIDPKASQMSHYPKVRDWLEKNRPDLKVSPAHMSGKTINKYFSSLFNELKKTHNL